MFEFFDANGERVTVRSTRTLGTLLSTGRIGATTPFRDADEQDFIPAHQHPTVQDVAAQQGVRLQAATKPAPPVVAPLVVRHVPVPVAPARPADASLVLDQPVWPSPWTRPARAAAAEPAFSPPAERIAAPMAERPMPYGAAGRSFAYLACALLAGSAASWAGQAWLAAPPGLGLVLGTGAGAFILGRALGRRRPPCGRGQFALGAAPVLLLSLGANLAGFGLAGYGVFVMFIAMERARAAATASARPHRPGARAAP